MVKRALEGLKGVSRADVSFRAKEARVIFDPAQVSVDELVAAIDRLGFTASVKPQGGREQAPGEERSRR